MREKAKGLQSLGFVRSRKFESCFRGTKARVGGIQVVKEQPAQSVYGDDYYLCGVQ